MRSVVSLFLAVGVLTLTGFAIHRTTQVGGAAEKGVLVPSGQWIKAAGRTYTFPGRAMDLAWLPDGTVLAKTTNGLLHVQPSTGKVLQTLASQGGSSMSGLLVSSNGKLALFSNAQDRVLAAEWSGSKWEWTKPIVLDAARFGQRPYPVGLAWIEDGKTAAVCLSRANKAAVLSVASRTATQSVTVDIAPYGVTPSPDRKSLLITCWSRRPLAGEGTQDSSGSPVPIETGGVAKAGSLVRVDLDTGKISGRALVGLQPTEVQVQGGRAYIASSNSDEIAVVGLGDMKIAARHKITPQIGLPLGSSPNALAFSPDRRTLYVACGGLNAVAAVALPSGRIEGWIPTGWFTGGLAIRNGQLAALGIKGTGSRAEADPLKRDAYDWTTSLTLLPLPSGESLAKMSSEFVAGLELEAMQRGLLVSRRKVAPVPVPERLGEPSVFRHVVFILKENRTYDQIFGDMPEGDGEPLLCLFPRPITPNHHALADRFGLLDNYYCNGILSADGHAWAMEGQTTTYFERSFGGWTRSYPFGDDPLAVSKSGYLWDGMIEKGISFRNFGEFDYAEPTKNESFKEIYDDFISGERKVKFSQKIGVAQLRRHSSPTYPGWNMKIPDVLRAEEFIKEFRQMERTGAMPQFTIIYLPQDHHSGDQPGLPTPRAHLADNDLALGRVMEALMASKFWPKMAVFCNEDDPGGGLDHVDGHRSICLVMSPYSRPGVNSSFYNQSSVFATMRRILGLGPLTHADARAPLMFDCFQKTPRQLSFRALTPSVPLDELNQPKALIPGSLDLSGPDRADEDLRNRKLWAVSRPGIPYPAQFGGAHGQGLKSKGLTLDPNVIEDDDED
jgi:hypothetical protein